MLKFDLPKHQSSMIKVIGVGGGGSNAVNYMFKQGIEGVDFIICNTDAQTLDSSPVPNKIQLGPSLTGGRGAGSIPMVGKNAAIETIDTLKEILEKNTEMLFITAGMGGGTGTGAAPVIASVAKELGILTVGIVTIPFSFEGRKRKLQAEEGINELRNNVDSLLIICNDKLRELYGNQPLSEAFSKADNILTTAAKGIAEIITRVGQVNVDIEDVKTVMRKSGVAIMGSGSAEGENRAIKAAEMALSSPLLNDNEIRGASNILLNITSGSEEISMDEVSEITDYIQSEAGSMADIIFGVVKDESIGNQINITLVATGFESGSEQIYPSSKEKDSQKVIHTLITENNSIETKNKTIVNEENFSEIKLKQPVNSSKNEISTNNTSEKSIELELFSYNSDSKPNKNNKIIQPFIHSNSENNELFLDVNKISENIEENAIQTDEDTLKKSKERIQKLRELSIKLKSPNGLQEMEQIPAYLRKNITLAEVVPSSESQISRLSLNEGDDNKVEIKSNNSFLHDNVD
ncbi:MAG: cell division protein FtsZ [Bacteroidetes bacterium CG2_30_32_10]|nr:MAG: cell division protein FtsZ [Bacteroidetes bacterium CG2_30_32_10]